MVLTETPVTPQKERPAPPTAVPHMNFLFLFSFAALFTLILPREFAGPDSPYIGAIYKQVTGGFRVIDLAILGIAGMVVALRAGTGSLLKLFIPKPLGFWTALFGLAIAVAVLYGSLFGASELFFDWRGIAVGLVFMLLIYQRMAVKPSAIHSVCFTLVSVLAARALYLLIKFLSGITTITMLDQRIPVFDGPTLSSSVFVAVAAGCLAFGWQKSGLVGRLILGTVSLTALLVVILAFRRTYWGEAAVALILVVLVFNKRRWLISLTVVVGFVVLLPFMPNEFVLRADSANPFTDKRSNPYTETNEDHHNDIADAWDVVKQHPILGYGLGRPYTTSRIRNWKFESWGVHNGPVHVWLRYGALGLISYLGLHFAVLRWLLGLIRRFNKASFERLWLLSIFSYIIATFVVSLYATPWAYGSTQNSLLIFSLIATALAIQNRSIPTARPTGSLTKTAEEREEKIFAPKVAGNGKPHDA